MNYTPADLDRQNVDGLRLLGLSRIPRCAKCVRLRALEIAYFRGRPLAIPLPVGSVQCTHRVCGPLVSRYLCGSGGTGLRVLRDSGESLRRASA